MEEAEAADSQMFMSMLELGAELETVGIDYSKHLEDGAKSYDDIKKKREKIEEEAGGCLTKCSHCGNKGTKLCTGCYQRYFCSDPCLQEHWKKIHRRECKGLRANFKEAVLVPRSSVPSREMMTANRKAQ